MSRPIFLSDIAQHRKKLATTRSAEFRKDDVRILLILLRRHPHLHITHISHIIHPCHTHPSRLLSLTLTFLKLLSPPKILPPIHVVCFLSGGAKILILISGGAKLCSSRSNRSGNFLVKVVPPERTMLLYRAERRSRSVRLMESTTRWCRPGDSRPIISGLKRISGARKRSWLILGYLSAIVVVQLW